MKKLLYGLALIPFLAFAGPSDIVTSQRNTTDTGSIPRTVAKPPGTQDGVMGFNGATALPVHWVVGPGLTTAGGILDAVAGGAPAWTSITGKPTFAPVATSGAYTDLTGAPVLFSGAYSDLSGIPSVFAPAGHTQPFSTITATPTTLAGYGITDAASAGALSNYATTAALTSGLAGKLATPTGTAAQYIRGDGSLGTLPTTPVRSQSAATRALNTAFQVSGSRDALVQYSVQITVTASIANGQDGDVFLDIASDSGFTTLVQSLDVAPCSQTYSVAVALQGVQKCTGSVRGYVPAGYYARIRTVNNVGAPVFAYRVGQEILL